MKILFLVPYPVGEAPSQRFRFEQYFPEFREKGIEHEISPFIDMETWQVLYQQGRELKKAIGITRGFFRRVKDLFYLSKYDYVFIHREAAPLGPPVFEWLIAKVFSKKIIYDFDDSIWLPNVSESNRFFSKIKWYHKVTSICRWSWKISVGNEYLAVFAKCYNSNVVVNPTIVNTENHYNRIKQHQSGKAIIGWTGTHSTIKYLNELLPVLKQIEEEADVEIRIISNAQPNLPLKKLRFIEWKKETEIDDLLAFDIGIMPLPDDQWAKGKCGFKLIQYLALGIPGISSPVGVNTKIIDDGKNGFLCIGNEAWLMALRTLIANPETRELFGKKGREKIINHFSTGANSPLFLNMFA